MNQSKCIVCKQMIDLDNDELYVHVRHKQGMAVIHFRCFEKFDPTDLKLNGAETDDTI